MNETTKFLQLLKDGIRKPNRKSRLPGFLKNKHASTASSLKLLADNHWK